MIRGSRLCSAAAMALLIGCFATTLQAQNAPAGQGRGGRGAGQPPAGGAAPAGGGRGAAGTPMCGPGVTGSNIAADSRCFELRIYTLAPAPGGIGDIDLLHKRFRDVTRQLFVKHGMTIIGFWQPLQRPSTLVYLMAYKDGATRDAEWAAFNADPDWVKARTEMNVRPMVESIFMNATDYSPLK